MQATSILLALSCSLVSLGGAASEPASPQQKGKTKSQKSVLWFEGEWAEAKKQAAERNAPIVVCCALDEEPDNEAFREAALGSKALAAFSTHCIVVPANNGTHRLTRQKRVIDGEKKEVEVCSAWHTRSCRGHQLSWDKLYQEFVLDWADEEDGEEGADWKLPEVIVIKPSGEFYGRYGQGTIPAEDDFVYAIEDIQQEFGYGLTASELGLIKGALGKALQAEKGKRWGDAYRHWDAVLAVSSKGQWADQARLNQPAALEGMQAQLAEVLLLLKPETIETGFRRLVELEVSVAETPLAKEVGSTIKRTEKDKVLKPATQKVRTELKAEAFLEEAKALDRSGERKKAVRIAKKLLGKKYKETPAAKQALDLFPELEKD